LAGVLSRRAGGGHLADLGSRGFLLETFRTFDAKAQRRKEEQTEIKAEVALNDCRANARRRLAGNISFESPLRLCAFASKV
jgi:hypothetical protein